MTADVLAALRLRARRRKKMSATKKYYLHPFRERLSRLMFSAFTVQGLTYGEMGRQAGIRRSTMNNYREEVCLPGAENLLRLADYFTAIIRKLNPECGFVLIDKLEQMGLYFDKEDIEEREEHSRDVYHEKGRKFREYK